MDCRYCGAENTADDHRCLKCGRRNYLAPAKVETIAAAASRAAVAQVLRSEQERTVHPHSGPRQATLFGEAPPVEGLRVVRSTPTAQARKELMTRVAPAGTPVMAMRTQAGQQRLDFPSPARPDDVLSDSAIYTEAPVALPVHRVMAASIDGAMVLIGLALFLGVLYVAGVPLALNAAAARYYALAAVIAMTLYRAMWCMASMDSAGFRWTGLRLVTFSGGIPGRDQRWGRMIASYLSWGSGLLGLAWALADEEKLAWHDHMSKTFPTPRGGLPQSSRRRPG